MGAKDIRFDESVRSPVLKGVETLAKAVKTTLGPKGRNVLIANPFGGDPRVTKDGVSVAKEVELLDPFENVGAMMVRQAARKTAEVAGDGTTTATVLAEAIYKAGLKYVTAGISPIELKRGIDAGVAVIRDGLIKMARATNDIEEIKKVGTISANGDTEIGAYIAEAMEQVGTSGVITVEESRGLYSALEVVDGMQFDRGFLSPFFCNNRQRMTAEFDQPYILVSYDEVTNMKPLIPPLEQCAKAGRPLIVIAPDVKGEALMLLVQNVLRGSIRACAVKAPGFGDRQKALLEDISIIVGQEGGPFGVSVGRDMENATLDGMGESRKIRITKNSTTIVDGAGNPDLISERLESIEKLVGDAETDFERDKQQERYASMSGGVAVLRIGAATETELSEKKDRVEDALAATKAAAQEGVVPGGGTALLCLGGALEELRETLPEEQALGVDILRSAIEAPIRQIAKNAGTDDGVVVSKVIESYLRSDIQYFGYNAATDEYGDMIEMGIIDPAKVVRCALENAASVAGLLLTTNCGIVPHPDDPGDTMAATQQHMQM